MADLPDPSTPEGLRAALERLGWTQPRLAEECGVSLRTVVGWLAGERTKGVPKPVARLVARALEFA